VDLACTQGFDLLRRAQITKYHKGGDDTNEKLRLSLSNVSEVRQENNQTSWSRLLADLDQTQSFFHVLSEIADFIYF